MRVFPSLFTAACLLFTGTPVFAAISSANIQACINVDVAPLAPINVNFIAGSGTDQCMSASGTDEPLTVDTKGLNCVSIGNVASSADDDDNSCDTLPSAWTLSYHTDDYAQSGTARTSWAAESDELRDSVSLKETSPGTQICPEEANCDATSQDWDHNTTPDIYIIFNME
ncbi:hypothetical protein [Pseudovibrio sp. Alg231-02]|uniref:hypothetical protein n=1 Tax=Pseudovibrio sp. Alg231-02 TaxID=1922223 RepID=UPI00131F3FC4|nr:hypothetical protein [Pseudovibrio sp. Alg231-02]